MRLEQISIFILIVIALNSCCCEGGKSDFAKLELINGTDYSIRIKGYDNYPNGIQRVDIPLVDNGSSWVSEKQKISGINRFEMDRALADSIVILFDRKRVYHETIDSVLSRRILGIPYGNSDQLTNFEIINVDKRNYIYRYTITQVEYDLSTELSD